MNTYKPAASKIEQLIQLWSRPPQWLPHVLQPPVYVCRYIRMYVYSNRLCMYVCMYICMNVCMYAPTLDS